MDFSSRLPRCSFLLEILALKTDFTKMRMLLITPSFLTDDEEEFQSNIDFTKSNPKINSSKPRDNNVLPVKTPPAVVHKSILLCDSNGKFLDKRKRFPPREDFTFCRSPTITQVRTILDCDEINQESGHPQLILIHSGTNDLTLATPIDDFISDISVLITQASTMFPKSKIIYSTLLPLADIPPPTMSKINMKLIDSLSTQPNVHHLVTAVRGRANTKTLRSSQIQYSALRPQPRACSTQRLWKSLVFLVTRLKTARLELTQLRGHNSLHHYARLL